MKILRHTESEQAEIWLKEAANLATFSTCSRAHCGSVVVSDNRIIGRGFNSPPANLDSQCRCNNRTLAPGFKSDRTCCIHAEQRAIMDTLKNQPTLLKGSSLYFVRLDEAGEIQFAGKPYCTICSKMALDSGITYFYLWHVTGITEYNTEEYNSLSFAYNGD